MKEKGIENLEKSITVFSSYPSGLAIIKTQRGRGRVAGYGEYPVRGTIETGVGIEKARCCSAVWTSCRSFCPAGLSGTKSPCFSLPQQLQAPPSWRSEAQQP
jgi:hypothetical protein